eukprot:2087326-Amphidinium_carterae.1
MVDIPCTVPLITAAKQMKDITVFSPCPLLFGIVSGGSQCTFQSPMLAAIPPQALVTLSRRQHELCGSPLRAP